MVAAAIRRSSTPFRNRWGSVASTHGTSNSVHWPRSCGRSSCPRRMFPSVVLALRAKGPPALWVRPFAALQRDRRPAAHNHDRRWSTVKDFEKAPSMKSAPFLLSLAFLSALAACSKHPQEVAPSVSITTPASAVATPASDPSLPSASVVVNAPPTPVDPPTSAPAGMPMLSATPATASGASPR